MTNSLTTIPRSIGKLQYATARLPLSLLERGVFARYLPDDAAARLGFERALGSLDSLAGRVLADESLARRGQALAHRAEFLETANKLESKAEARRIEAEEQLEADKVEARRAKQEAQQDQSDKLSDVRRQERADKQEARQKAEASAAADKARADKEAAKRVQATEKAEKAEHDRIAARHKSATAAPKQGLADANRKQSDAQERRSEADRLAHLASVERAERRSD